MAQTLLAIKSSILGENSQSAALLEHAMQVWQAQSPTHQVKVRDVVTEAIPHLDSQRVGAFFTPAEQRNAEQQAVIDFSDQLIAELRDADAVIVGLPMYNFGISSHLKAYFDHIARAGVTFKYTEQGPVGLLQDKPVALLATRGGMYHAAGLDHQVPFVKQFFGFIGLQQTQAIFAEGIATPEKLNSLQQAQQQLDAWLQARS